MADLPHVPGIKELTHLVSFVGVAERGNFRATAGELPIAAGSVPGERHLPALLSALHSRHPLVRVRATVSDTVRSSRMS
jgi:DNA-binding transcriptional LysR family regulator